MDILEAVKITSNRVKPFDAKKRYLTTGNLFNHGIDNFLFVDYENKPSRADLMVREGDLILARMKATNKVFLIDCDSEDLIVSTGFLTLKPKDGFDGRYLYHYFRSKIFQRLKDRFCSGATQKAINNNSFKKLKVPHYEIEQQKKIAQILDAANNFLQKRKEQLALLDDYLKSVFLDMFGDPMENEKAWKIVKLGDVIIDGPQNGLYKPSSFYGNGVPILRIDCFYNGTVTDIAKLKRVVVTDEELRRFQINEDDIVINRVNSRSHLGKCALIPGISEKTVFESNMMRLTVDKTKVLPLFLSKFLTTPFVKKQILSSAKDAVNQSSINQNDVNNFELFLPTINLQYKFVSIVGQVEQTKQKMRDSLDEMDNHFNALMQRYFV